MSDSILPASLTQATRLLRLTTPLGADALVAECVRGEEAISAPFTFDISALSTDAGIGLRALLGQPALLELLTVAGAGVRAFHGHLTAVAAIGANGGLARYKVTLQPWTAFLSHGRDSRVFQDMTVCDILDAVFGAWQGQGRLAPAWRFELADRALYPKRSLTTQYQESDLAFAERLMHEEGLFYFFEHHGDATSATLGRHEMVIADHNGAFAANAQPLVRYTQPGAVMREDSMDRWRSEIKLQTGAVAMSSWDYRTLDMRPVDAGGATQTNLVSSDSPGPYAYASRTQGQRIADNQLQALQTRRETFTGAGTVRTLAAGTTFALDGHALFGSDTAASSEAGFIVTRVVHLMHNNLSAELQSQVVKEIGAGALARALADEMGASLHATGNAAGARPLYRNRIDAIRASVPYKASATDGHGVLLHPRPTIHGQQSAVVVGPADAMLHTDRDHRVKVQFHWQRGTSSHSRLQHPAADSHTGAPADDSAGTWVRVAAPLAPVAGANWGANALPRVGQEVLVDFLEGNIDRPVIIGALYNGAGASDAAGNQVAQGAGAATGNAPAWFPGEAAAHAHPAVLSGLKSQTMASSQGGSGAYSQLVFDDSAGQPRIGLQRHAGAHLGTAELNLGVLRQQSDNERLKPVGFGLELKTEHATALRAGRGMLLSTDMRASGQGTQMDAKEAQQQIDASAQLQTALATTAQQHNAGVAGDGAAEPAPEKLPAVADMTAAAEAIGASAAGSAAAGSVGGAGAAPSFSAAQLQLSALQGIVAVTPVSAQFQSGASSAIVAGQDIDLAAQGNAFGAIKAGIGIFTYGKASAASKPNQETGLAVHAASGKFSSRSQSDATQLTADKAIIVASVTKNVTVAAKQHVLLTAQGAYLTLEGGNIMIHGPGTMLFKASMKELTGPQNTSLKLPLLPKSQAMIDAAPLPLYSQRIVTPEIGGLTPEYAGMPFEIWTRGKPVQVASGTLDQDGKSARVFTESPEELSILLGDATWDLIAAEENEPSPHGDADE
jgi:type VI secretion system secreted protein VgrG